MSESFYTILTNAGLAAIANATVNQKQVNFAKIGVGDGNGAYYTPTQEATALRKQVWVGNVSSVTTDPDNANWVVVETVIPGNVGGFEIRELGIFDENNVLLAIGKLPLTYKPNFAEGSSKDLYIKAIFEVTNASAVTLKVDPSVIYASKKYVDDKVATVVSGLENLQQQLNQHITDPSNIKWIETVGGTANSLTAIHESISSYKNGLGLSFPVKSNSTAAMSLNINGLGAIPIKKANGIAFSNGKAGGVYTVRYRDGAFILQGEGGAGNAQPSEVLVGKTFTNDSGEFTGTMQAGGVIKGIQRGTTVFNSTDARIYININKVNLATSFIRTSFYTNDGNEQNSLITASFPDDSRIMLFRNNPTNTTCRIVIEWEVVEFVSGVKVSSGATTIVNNSYVDVSVPNYFVSRSLVFITYDVDLGGNGYTGLKNNILISTTNSSFIRFSRDSSVSQWEPCKISWFLVEFI